ncbi:MAG: FtsX-like permease family protein [Streptosporangiaceae bacterium]|jgi:putative ABC transport system permease protein
MPGAGPVARAVGGGLARRKVQTLVIGLVLLVSTGACVLALGLVVDSSAPFDKAFAAQHGADVVATVDRAVATPGQLAATARLPEVTAAAGPYPEAMISPQIGGRTVTLQPMTVAGRGGPGGPLDDLVIQQGRWAQRPGELVLSSDSGPGVPLGTQITVSGVPGTPRLTAVGYASSINRSADGWVVPSQVAALRAPGAPATAQMLYRFASAGSAAALRTDAGRLSAALPSGAVTGTQSYLAVKAQETSGIAPIAPFVVAFGIIGLVMSALIVINIVSGAVVAGYRRIGILKSIGFTPAQLVGSYAGLITVPAVAGCIGGVLLGNALSVPLLGSTATVYGVGALGVPVWVDVLVPCAMCCLAGIAALLPSLRAGRLSAVQAIAIGRAPAAGRGYAAHRLLGRLSLPRPVTIGLAAPFARPARAAGTLAAVGLGAIAVTFAVGLSSSLNMVADGLSHAKTEPVQVTLVGSGRGGQQLSPSAQQAAVEAALRAQPGTLHYVAQADQAVSVAGLSGQVRMTAFRGNADWTGYDMISGHWYSGPGQVDVPTNFLTVTGKAVGDTVTFSVGGAQVTARIVGEVFDTDNQGLAMLTDWRTLAAANRRLTPYVSDVALRAGTSPEAYVRALGSTLGPYADVSINGKDPFFLTLIGLTGTLTLLLAAVAGLGVLNTVLLHTRERAHDLGIFKAIGMTPRQTIAMVVCSVAGTGLVAGLLAVPAGMAAHRYVLPVMAHAAGTGIPASYLAVYRVWEIAVLALAGLVIAAAGGIPPAAWAARARTAAALHAE